MHTDTHMYMYAHVHTRTHIHTQDCIVGKMRGDVCGQKCIAAFVSTLGLCASKGEQLAVCLLFKCTCGRSVCVYRES